MSFIAGVDVDALNHPGFDFPAAIAAGYKSNYIKLGGGNAEGNVPYVLNGYRGQVDANRAAGADRTGHYWLTGGHDPAVAATFFLANIHWLPGDFVVLDNETLDYGNSWTDPECVAFFRPVLAQLADASGFFLYGSKIGQFGNGNIYPLTRALGVRIISADYNNTPLVNYVPAGIPTTEVAGHQFGAVTIGAQTVDGDAFTLDAFASTTSATPEEDDMYSDQDRARDNAITRALLELSEIQKTTVMAQHVADITSIYRVRLGREPDESGLGSYLLAMIEGATKTQVDASVQKSTEYKNRIAAEEKK